MLVCKACVQKCVRTVLIDELSFHSFPSRISSTAPAYSILRCRRNYATAELRPPEDTPSPSPNIAVGITTPYRPQSTRSVREDEPFSRSSLEQELRWLRDPLKLGDHTVKLLRQDENQKALAIVRLASNDVECSVSWNHLIDYNMSKGKVTDAVKLYNEMKKRAQRPDAHTFTALFRGFSWYPKFPLSVSRTLSIYHSMYADTSPCKPSLIHTNAVLKVCALAGDIDALLGVAARLPARGNGAPNNLTFTTILNAIRSEAWEFTKGQKDGRSKRDKQLQAVMQGRRLWEEIRERWEKGDLHLDEELVCAMGRLMLIANDESNCDDILSLIEQTMGVPRQIPRQGEPGRRGATRSLQPLDIPPDSDLPSLDEMVPVAPPDISGSEDPPGPEGDPFALLSNGPPSHQAKIRPDRNTLSLVLDACTRIRIVRAAQNYWGLLTDPAGPYKIIPDTENYHMYLRLLRVQRASKMAVDLIDDMCQGVLGPRITPQIKTFRIGLSTCVRDKQNRNAISHAKTLVRMMNNTLEHPDPRALSMYIDLGISQQPRDWRTLMGMIRETDMSIANLRSLLSYDSAKGHELHQGVKELVKLSIGAIDVTLDLGNEDLTNEERQNLKEKKYSSQAWITRKANLENSIKKSGHSGKWYLIKRERQQVRPGDEEIGAAHEDIEANAISVRGTTEGRGRGEEKATNGWQRNKRRWKDKSIADSWKRFTEE